MTGHAALKPILVALIVWLQPLGAFAGDCVQPACFGGPLTLVVPSPPGSATDIVARTWALQLSSQLGQPILFSYKAGTRGILGTAAVANSPRDGLTILVTNNRALLIAPLLHRTPAVHPMTDLVPVGRIALAPQVLVVLPHAPYKNLQEFLAQAASRSSTYGSPAPGSPGHLLGQRLVIGAGATRLAHVAFPGAGAALSALRAGTLDAFFADLGSVLADLQSGKLRALAVSGDHRVALAPDVPTFAEQGVPGFESAWFAAFLRAGTDPAIVNRLAAESRRALASPEVQSRLRQASLESATLDLAAFTRAMAAESAGWTAVVKRSGITVE